MKVLCINCSGRENSNSKAFLIEAMKGLNNLNIQTNLIFLRDYTIHPCEACDECFGTGICKLNDDFALLYDMIMESDHLIFASPIYFYSLPGHFKVFIDRFQSVWNEQNSYKEEQFVRFSALILTAGKKGDRSFENALITMKYFLKTIQSCIYTPLLNKDCDLHPEDISLEMKKKSFDYGQNYGIFLKQSDFI